MPLTQGYNLFYNRVYNRQVIRVLQIALKNMRVCQNVHILFFMHKAPTFSSQGFAIS